MNDMQLDIKPINPAVLRAKSECGSSTKTKRAANRGEHSPRPSARSSLFSPALDMRFAGRVRKEQLGAILRLTPAMMLANLANGSLLLLAFWQDDERPLLATWFLALTVIVMFGLRAWIRSQTGTIPETVSPRGLKRAVWHALVLGVVWAAVPLMLFEGATEPQRALLAALITGMIAGGAFVLSSIPAAALAYSLALTIASMITLLINSQPIYMMIAGLLLTYALIVISSIYWHANLFVQRLESQFNLERQNELIGLLLRDFEESASDWLWETDGEGKLQHISPRFAEVTGKNEDLLQGVRLIDFLQETNGTTKITAKPMTMICLRACCNAWPNTNPFAIGSFMFRSTTIAVFGR